MHAWATLDSLALVLFSSLLSSCLSSLLLLADCFFQTNKNFCSLVEAEVSEGAGGAVR
jgi:hypothetical protein